MVKRMGHSKTIDYMLDRTLLRPRDIIQFFNACIRQADGSTLVSAKALLEAEGVYSRERISALADEWIGLYPNIVHLSHILQRRKQAFFLDEITAAQLEENYLELLVSGRGEPGLDRELMEMAFQGHISADEYRASVILILYKVGIVGLKTDVHGRFLWSKSGQVGVSSTEILASTKVMAHPMFWRFLGIDFKVEG